MNGLNQTQSSAGYSGIRALLEEEGAVIREAHFAGAGGSEVVQRRTSLIDRILRETHVQLNTDGSLPVLLAVGGYGRGEMNPYSDIDIMLLCRDERDRQRSPDLLYPLWDAGMDVGYSVRTIDECVALARQDIKIRTSLFESRHIAGSPDLFATFLKTMQSEVFYWRVDNFIKEKLADRGDIRQKFGGSIYLREPNIKEGTGGLRDIHTAMWAAFARFRTQSLDDLAARKLITEGQLAVFLRSRGFLWRLRNEIHYLSGRKNDHLTFDLQERVAKDFKYRDSAHLLAVERFMKAYFIHARNIREFSNIIIDAVLHKPSWKWYEHTIRLGPFSIKGRTLFPASDTVIKENPSLSITAFELAHLRHATLSDHLKEMIRLCRISDEVRASSSASAAFCSILNNPDGLSQTLILMKELKLLGRYLPEFRAIQALARHDYYHRYTVDEHILLAIRNLELVWTGQLTGHPTLAEAFRSVKKRWILTLALLLHDLGKAFRDNHELRGEELAKGILDRLGIVGDDRQRILLLIRHHVVMTLLSQRRELGDRKVIDDFARLVQDRENLNMLYLLTYADISAVNPTAWTQWKSVLLRDLYVRTLHSLEGRANLDEETQDRLASARERITRGLQGRFPLEEIEAYLATMPEQYILMVSNQRVADHLEMMRVLPKENLVIRHRHEPERGYTELTVCAYDAYGMFYRTAGAIAAKHLSILRAQVFTSKQGVMLDTFQITDPAGNMCDYEDVWESVRTDLRNVLMHGGRPPEPGLFKTPAGTTVVASPTVEFDNTTSDQFTIIDITARDRVGFLYHVARTLFELNLDICSAKIVTEGSRVMDAFYVTDLFRRKIDDSARLIKIKDALTSVIA